MPNDNETDWEAEGKTKKLEGEIQELKGEKLDRPAMQIAGAIEKGLGQLQEEIGKAAKKLDADLKK